MDWRNKSETSLKLDYGLVILSAICLIFKICDFISDFEFGHAKGSYTTAQRMKFAIKDFVRKCDQIRRKLQIWSYLLKKSLMKNFIFCAVYCNPEIQRERLNLLLTTYYHPQLKIMPKNQAAKSLICLHNYKKLKGISLLDYLKCQLKKPCYITDCYYFSFVVVFILIFLKAFPVYIFSFFDNTVIIKS